MMRMYAYLKEPLPVNKNDYIYKIMIHEMKRETLVYKYISRDAIQCSFDDWYPDKDSAVEDWQELIDEKGWIMLDDPLPDCQDDAFLPIRVKGRNINKPQWGELEILENGIWTEYKG
ncbi:MAG: hypothetical protein K2O32_11895 [Acetatifactor sp.]|nr:hypothetical protein [Acetatifactor sp.]